MTTVAIPRKVRPTVTRHGVERRRRFRKLVKWRTGAQGRISHLKHSYGWARTLFDGVDGARTWCRLGAVLTTPSKSPGSSTNATIDVPTAPKRNEHPHRRRTAHPEWPTPDLYHCQAHCDTSCVATRGVVMGVEW
ncbi:MAG: hypothetical protein ACRD0U_10080 [Acidimicrobiales bacterium]